MKPTYRAFTAIFFIAGAFLWSCQTTESTVPTVQAISVKAGKVDLTTLEHGRIVFLRNCAECHRLQPIEKHSVARWHEILGIMGPRARLSAPDRAALEAYLVAARRSYPE